MNEHLDERQLNDCVDGTLETTERERVTLHLASCDVCQQATQRLRQLRADLGTLPRSITPPAHVLMGVHAAIAESVAEPPVRLLPARRWNMRPSTLAAAAVLLMALSSATTVLLLRPSPTPESTPAITTAVTPAADNGSATLIAMDRTYQDAIADLQRALRQQESGLAPETLQVLQANLEIIDRALAEARTALRADPGNDALTALVRSGYERKLDVLRSASSHVRASS